MITVISDFFTQGCGRCDRFGTPDCSTKRWKRGLADLRRICLGTGLEETLKWAHPCYVHAGRNIAIFGAFREDFRLTFFNAGLMKDSEGVLEKAGPNTQEAGVLRFTTDAQVLEMKPIIVSYLNEAKGYAERGIKPKAKAREIDLPQELVEAMQGDPELATAFLDLTPGRQRSYVVNLNSAKKSDTRISRIARFRSKILTGKGALER